MKMFSTLAAALALVAGVSAQVCTIYTIYTLCMVYDYNMLLINVYMNLSLFLGYRAL